MKELLTFGQQAFSWTWKTSLQAAFLVVLVLVLQKLLGRWLTPRLRYALSLLVVCRLLLPVAPPSPLSLENLLLRTARPAETIALAPSETKTTHAEPNPTPMAGTPLRDEPSFSLAGALGIGWFSGFLGLIVFAVWRYGRWSRLIRSGKQLSDQRVLKILDAARDAMGVRRAVTIVSVARLSSPAVIGIWKVCLLLPETVLLQLSDRELRLIFMHEMAHVRRNDPLLNVALMAVQFLHWFNPLVWFGLHRLRADRELVCDAMVIQRAGEGERLGYGQLLIKLLDTFSAAPRVFPTAVPVVGNKHDVKRRILSIKHHQPAGVFAWLATSLSSVTLVLATFTCASEQSPAGDAASYSLGRSTTGRQILQVTNSATATNGAIIRHGPTEISAKELTYNNVTGQVVARGEVRVQQNGQIWSGEQLTYNLKTNQTPLEQFVAEVKIMVLQAQLVKEADIRTNIHAQVGVPFDSAVVDQDVRDLYASGLFHIVRVSNKKTDEGMKLLYLVQCNPRLVGLEFKGNTTFSDLDLQKTVISRVGTLYNEKRLFSDGQLIQEKYEKAGYQGTTVKYVGYVDEAVGEAKVTFEITETR